jgi:hypothetical protein
VAEQRTVVQSQRTVWNGTPGTFWVNDTGKARYQFICSLANTCGFCLQYHLAIAASWGIPLHFGCNCNLVRIAPDATSVHPFVDFRDLLDAMPHDQQVAAIGASNYKLLKEGIADWKDIVTPMRVRSLREVVSIKKLSVKRLVDAGVKPRIAEVAHASVNTPEHVLIEAERQRLMDQIKQAGLNQDQLTRQIAGRLAERVVIGQGPPHTITGAPSWETQTLRETVPHAAELAAIMRGWRPPPAPVSPSAERRQQAIDEAKQQEQEPHSNPLIAEAQRMGAEAGVRTLVIDDEVQVNRIWKLAADETAASYRPESDLILINARSKYWQQAEIDAAHARGWLSTNDPNHFMNHELGHYANRHNISQQRWDELYNDNRPLNAAMAARTRKEVSQYAATSRLEFVAEVHAGLKAGKEYGPKIMRDYDRWGGARPGEAPVKIVPSVTSPVARTAVTTPVGRVRSNAVVPVPVEPRGVPVGKALDTSQAGMRKDQIDHAINVIDTLHGDGELKTIPVVNHGLHSENQGQFEIRPHLVPGFKGTADRIAIKEGALEAGLLTAHETGHFVEMFGIPGGNAGYRKWAKDTVMTEWKDAVKESHAFKSLDALAGVKEGEINPKYTSYLLRQEELWARSYAQWVAHRSQDSALLGDLNAMRDPRIDPDYHHQQWTDHDFEPIAKSIDKLFKGLGWIK